TWQFLFFFFQAEDGIRDATVTGVRTCALPIYPRERQGAGGREEAADVAAEGEHGAHAHQEPAHAALVELAARRHPDRELTRQERSEERRVGKEGRSGRVGGERRRRVEGQSWDA